MTSWTTPTTWSDGSTPTATNLNTHIRDNLSYLYENRDWPFGFPVAGDPAQAINNSTIGFAVANECIYERVRGYGSVSSIAIHVTTSSGNIGLAVYDDNGEPGEKAAPAARTVTTGSISCPAIGYAVSALSGSDTVGAGTHWFALSCSNTTARFHGAAGAWQQLNSARGWAVFHETGHPPPSTALSGVPTHPMFNMVGL